MTSFRPSFLFVERGVGVGRGSLDDVETSVMHSSEGDAPDFDSPDESPKEPLLLSSLASGVASCSSLCFEPNESLLLDEADDDVAAGSGFAPASPQIGNGSSSGRPSTTIPYAAATASSSAAASLRIAVTSIAPSTASAWADASNDALSTSNDKVIEAG